MIKKRVHFLLFLIIFVTMSNSKIYASNVSVQILNFDENKPFEDLVIVTEIADVEEIKEVDNTIETVQIVETVEPYELNEISEISEIDDLDDIDEVDKINESIEIVEPIINKTSLSINKIVKNLENDVLIINNSSLFPLRDCANTFNAEISWSDADKKATVTKNDTSIIFSPNTSTYYVNGVEQVTTNNVVPVISDGLMYIPIRNLAENLGYTVSYDANTKIINCQSPNDNLILVNKDHLIEPDYVPSDLVYTKLPRNKEMQVSKEANEALTTMFSDAKDDNLNLYLVSAYRTPEYQEMLYNNSLKNRGATYTDKYILKPLQSEHHTGLALDITSKSNGYSLNEAFTKTNEYKWLNENAYKYGFILRYPKDGYEQTKINFEPWHYRYVGNADVAKYITDNNLTLEEYLAE